MRTLLAALTLAAGLTIADGAGAYGWPLKPFHSPHPIRGTFGDPRFHLDSEGAVSAFHFGVDIAAADGTPVYSVTPGVVVRLHTTSVTIGRASGRRFGYWHIRPVVRSGWHVRLHQLLGFVQAGWGHVHFAESIGGEFRNPLRKGALSPFYDHTVPTIEWVQLLTPAGSIAPGSSVTGPIDIKASIYDTPPLAPPAPWDVARLAPAQVWWTLTDSNGVAVASSLGVNFQTGLPSNDLYNWIYASGSYQNKPHRPGLYLYWLAHGLDTTGFPNGHYTLQVAAADTRHNVGTSSTDLTIANAPGG